MMTEEYDIQYCIQVPMDDNSILHLSSFIDSGSPADLGVPKGEAVYLYYEFLLDMGSFNWPDAERVVKMLGVLQRSDFYKEYVQHAVDRARALDDLALIGGDDSFCAVTARQLLKLDVDSLELLKKSLQRFVALWERNLRLTIDLWPDAYQRLALAVDLALSTLSQKALTFDGQFENLVSEFGPLITRIASSYVGDPALQEDLVQQIFLAVWQALPSYHSDKPMKTFITKIAQNRAISFVTKQVRQQVHSPLSEAIELIHAEGPTPEESAIYLEERLQLLEAVRALPSAQRDVIVLVLEGLSYQDIAAILEIAPNALALRLSRAKAALMAMLSPSSPEPRSR